MMSPILEQTKGWYQVIMGFFIAAMTASLISFAYYAATMSTTDASCLLEPETASIIFRWLSIFETDMNGTSTGAELIDSSLASEFQLFDEGATFGNPAPALASREAVYETVTANASAPAVVGVKYEILYIFSSCNVTGVRWQYSAFSAKTGNVTVPVGTPIRYLDTEYLQVDLKTRLIYNVTCSADIVNYYKQIGHDVLAAR
ncbi:hypothetical protein CLAFUR4_14381 [Fulvia fulva]|nr:hypothetical protein CLAFUR4_14381 [Fulvia fulva]WPV37615.1 hypothetical protein CLAFUW7_14390 [Fulvia fulva]